jgi:transposase
MARPDIRIIDWKEVLIDLRRHGYNSHRVALELNIARQTVEKYLNYGSEPSFSIGHRILVLYGDIMRREQSATKAAHMAELAG